MTPFLGAINGHANGTAPQTNTDMLLDGTRAALNHLLIRARAHLPAECLPHLARAHFSTANTGTPYFPSPLKQTEAISALKAVEAAVAASIADLGNASVHERKINVDLERASAFLFSTYLATVGGMDKAHPKVKKYLKGKPYSDIHFFSPVDLFADLYQTPTFSKHSPYFTVGFLQTYTRRRFLVNISIFMGLWKLRKP